jgi:hypothetical protein
VPCISRSSILHQSLSFRLSRMKCQVPCVRMQLLACVTFLFRVQARPACFGRSDLSPSLSGNWEPVSFAQPTKGNNNMLYDTCSGSFGSSRSCTAKHMLRFAAPAFWRVGNCSLPDFRVERFSKALGNRTLWLLGDSITQQHKTRLGCLVREFNPERGHSVEGLRVSHTRHFETQISRKRLSQVAKGDVVLFNVGMHFNNIDDYKYFLNLFEKACLQHKCVQGTIVWVETAAQHFPGPDSKGGIFGAVRGGRCARGCVQHDYSAKQKADFRNRMANILMAKYRIPILRTWDVTATAFNMHSQDKTVNVCDCTHYCNSPWGVFRVYNRILQAFLEAFPPGRIPPAPSDEKVEKGLNR